MLLLWFVDLCVHNCFDTLFSIRSVAAKCVQERSKFIHVSSRTKYSLHQSIIIIVHVYILRMNRVNRAHDNKQCHVFDSFNNENITTCGIIIDVSYIFDKIRQLKSFQSASEICVKKVWTHKEYSNLFCIQLT